MNIGDTIKSAIKGMPVMVTGGQPAYRAGENKLAWADPRLTGPEVISVWSDAFDEGKSIPASYSADEKDISPPLGWSVVPEKTGSVALVVEDPDAPTPYPFVHWLVYNIPADVKNLPEDFRSERTSPPAGAIMQGENSNLKVGWTGMAPPKGDTPHRYFFQIFALNITLSLKPDAGRSALFNAMAGHVIGRGRAIGTYQRS